jgi:cytochrome c553
MKKIILIAALAAVSAGLTHAAGDAAAGKTKSMVCAACHGADGNSVNPEWPKLAGQHSGYLLKQLKNFKGGPNGKPERENALMAGQVATLSEADMADLAAYFESQKVALGEAAKDKLEAGQAIYRGGNPASGVSACIACHGPNGAGNPQALFPSLSGQHATYTIAQLKAFRSGARANDAGQMMRNIASKMTDAEIEAVAQYVQGLH